MEHGLLQVLLLLGAAVGCIMLFQRLHIPTSLAYLFVGVVLGPHTIGPVVDSGQVRLLAEFGIVFLLFTIGLSFSLPQLHAMRNQVLGLGTAQVLLTTLVVAAVAWSIGLPPIAAFVVGAVFAQSSTTIISKQLVEQGEDTTSHGRLGTAMSVFQDVTAVPFVVIIPVLGAAAGLDVLATTLGWALGKAVLALVVVFFVGRWLLRPLFHTVTQRRSLELFTLAVLLVSLAAAWVTNALGLSLAFGAFLAGMVLGETEFRHQVESAIRPFRDVLLGLFFIGIGMLFDPASLPDIWEWALAGAVGLLLIKTLLVAVIVRWSGLDVRSALRTGLVVAVGGEFGFALLSLALSGGAIGEREGQIALTSVLFSMVVAPFLIRFNGVIAERLTAPTAALPEDIAPRHEIDKRLGEHVVICGYGRIGQSVAHFLEREQIPFIGLDLDASRVREAHLAGEPIFYGDALDPVVLESVGLMRAKLLLVATDDSVSAFAIIQNARALRTDVPIMVRTRDEQQVDALRKAGATEVVPETLEAGLMIASHVLLMLNVPIGRVFRMIQAQRAEKYRLLRGYFRGDSVAQDAEGRGDERLRPFVVGNGSPSVGKTLDDLGLGAGEVSAIVSDGEREVAPPGDRVIRACDTIVVYGTLKELDRAQGRLLG